MGDLEDHDPSEDEWDEWDMDVEEAYEEAGDADFEDCSWKDALKEARSKENDLPQDEALYDEAEDADFEDFSWKDLVAKGTQTNDDLPADDANSQLSDSDDAASTEKKDLSTDEEEPPEMRKIGKAMMEARGTAMSDLPD